MTLSQRQSERRAVVAALGMVAASGAAMVLRPKQVVASPQARLADIVPDMFGNWSVEEQAALQVVNPNLEQIISTIYADTLSRVYVDGRGQRMMLALAYGQNQNRDLQVHKPEVCYVAQGFRLVMSEKCEIATRQGAVPAMRIVARLGPRVEPITYWIRVGDQVIRGWLEQNTARVRLGLKGILPDGLLVRVSSIDDDTSRAFERQQAFLSDMLSATAEVHRTMLIGRRAA